MLKIDSGGRGQQQEGQAGGVGVGCCGRGRGNYECVERAVEGAGGELVLSRAELSSRECMGVDQACQMGCLPK